MTTRTESEVKIPQAPDAEAAVLGGSLLDGRVSESVRRRLEPSMFFVYSNRRIFEAMLRLDARRVKLDPVVIAEELRQMGALDAVGGCSYISALMDRGIHGDADNHIALVVEAAEQRRVWTASMEAARLSVEGERVEALKILRQVVADTDQADGAAEGKPVTLAATWADFDLEEFKQGEHIAFAVERGELALLNALPNIGKTTLALNVALCLAAGREFLPLVTGRTPRRVLYIDGETTRRRLQRDLRVMTRDFSREEAMAVGQNLHIICEAEIKGEPLALTNAAHLLALSAGAIDIKPDFIVVDTLAALCPLYSENDNGEQGRKIWRPLQKLARDCDAAMLINHHVGKRSEDSQTPERVYRGRGASASGGAARAVWLLIPEASTPGAVKLVCAKSKCEPPADVVLTHNRETRWMDVGQAAPPLPTTQQRVVGVFNGHALGVTDVMALLPDLSKPTIERALKSAVERGDLENPKRGKYQKPVSITSITPYRDEGNDGNSEPVEPAEDSFDWPEGVENDDCEVSEPYDEGYLDAIDR
jgi:hypothetical protein